MNRPINNNGLKIVLSILFIIGMVMIISYAQQIYMHNFKTEQQLFDSVDDARRYQRQCIDGGGSAVIHSDITGITVKCRGTSQ